jgi:hypothetical protein
VRKRTPEIPPAEVVERPAAAPHAGGGKKKGKKKK